MNAVSEFVGRYRAAGWKTVPVHTPDPATGGCSCGTPGCAKPGKHPVARFWPGGADDPAHFAGRNVGVLLGPDSANLADVDLDCREAVAVADLLLPPTGAAFGRGGAVTHRVYTAADGVAAFAQLTDPVLPGREAMVVELRWPNADEDTGLPKAVQTVFPPSAHSSGDVLAWAGDGAPAAVPGGDLAAAVRRVGVAVLVARYARPKARHDLVLLLANLGVRAGWADDDLVVRFIAAAFAAKGDDAMVDRVRRGEAANAVADARKRVKAGRHMTGLPALHRMLDPALSPADADAVVSRVRDWLGLPGPDAAGGVAGDDPWPDPIPLTRPVAVPPFPADVLPPWVRDWAEAVATEKQVPLDLPALLALGLVGAGLARKVVARPRPGFAEPVNLFVMPVLPPGERKTQSLAAALAPVRDLERDLRDAARPAVAAAESDFRVAEARVKGLEGKLAKAEDPDQKDRLREQLAAAREELLKVEVPPLPLLYTEDDTPDALKAEVIRQGGRLMVASTEAKCLENITLYSDRPNFDVYLKGHAGDELKTGRVSRGRASVSDPALSCLLAPQPAVLEGLAASAALKGRGFLARWAYAIPESRVGRRAIGAPAVPSAVQAAYHRHMTGLWQTGYGADPETGAPAATVLGFDPGADAAFRAFEAEVEPLLAAGGPLGGLAGWGNKLCGLCARLAAGLHVADAAGAGREWAAPIGEGAVRRAARLCREYLVPHARAAFGLMGADAKLAAARRVWRWVAGSRVAEFTKRDCFNALRAHFETVDQLQPALDLLERHFLVRAKAAPERRGRGRRSSPVYEVNPGADGDGDGAPAALPPLGPNSAYCARGSDPSPAAAAGGARNSADCAHTSGGGSGAAAGSAAAQDARDGLGTGPHNPQNSNSAVPLISDRPGRGHAHNTQNSIAAGTGTPGWGQDLAHNTQNSAAADPGEPVAGEKHAHNTQNSAAGPLHPGAAAPGPVTPPEAAGPAYTLVTAAAGLADVVAAVEDAGVAGVDCETTGLDPRTARVRLLQVATDRAAFVIDVFALSDPAADLAELFEALARVQVVAHHAAFDLAFLARLGFAPGRVFDTMLAAQVLGAGTEVRAGERRRFGLADVAGWVLGRAVAKDEQASDWSRPALTPAQLAYAAADAAVLLPLADRLREELGKSPDLLATADLEMRALPGVAWAAPVRVDAAAWRAIAGGQADAARRLAEEMNRLAPKGGELFDNGRNWNSTEEVRSAFLALGVELDSTDDDALAGIKQKGARPLADLVREYRAAGKLAGTYGERWLEKHVVAGGVWPSWNQLGAGSGRMSCSDPNLQQVPRDGAYRRCFVAGPGNVLVKADHSQVELRVAAVVAGEPVMLDAYAAGRDLHTLTAARLLGKPEGEVAKPDRQLAKAVNFGLLYGMGWKSLRAYAGANYGVVLTDAEARRHRDAFFTAYPAVGRWHDRTRELLKRQARAGDEAGGDGPVPEPERGPELPRAGDGGGRAEGGGGPVVGAAGGVPRGGAGAVRPRRGGAGGAGGRRPEGRGVAEGDHGRGDGPADRPGAGRGRGGRGQDVGRVTSPAPHAGGGGGDTSRGGRRRGAATHSPGRSR